MARLVGTSFQGATVYETEPEALTKRSWLRKVCEDAAMIQDIVTGDGSPPLTLNHTGEAVSGQAGALLGVPCTQMIRQAEGDHGLASGATAGTPTYFAFVPWYKPVGETEVTVAFHGTPGLGYELKVLSAAGAEVAAAGFLESPEDGLTTYFARVDGLTADPNSGSDQLYFIAIKGTAYDIFRRIWGLRVFYRIGGPAGATVEPGDGTGNSVTLNTNSVSGATVTDFIDIGSSFVGDNDEDYVGPATAGTTLEEYGHGVNGYVLTKVAQNQAAIWERATGAPAPGNETLTLADSGAADPTQGAFLDGSLAGKIYEEPFGFPLAIISNGSIPVDGTHNSGKATNRYAPGLKTLSLVTHQIVPLMTPDFPDAGSSKLRACVVCCTPDEATPFATKSTVAWDARTVDEAGTSIDTHLSSTWTQIGSTRFAYQEWTNIDFDADAGTMLQSRFDASALGALTGESFRVLGLTLHFET